MVGIVQLARSDQVDQSVLTPCQVVSRLIHMLGERILGSYNRLSHYSTTNIASTSTLYFVGSGNELLSNVGECSDSQAGEIIST